LRLLWPKAAGEAGASGVRELRELDLVRRPPGRGGGVTVADTWDETGCRARLAGVARPYDVIACRELDRHAAADLEAALAEIDRLRAALMRVQEWDCLNPPRQDLLHDLPWLRRLVDEALGAGQGRPDDLGGTARD
jgi:hypothetical protein